MKVNSELLNKETEKFYNEKDILWSLLCSNKITRNEYDKRLKDIKEKYFNNTKNYIIY